MRANNAGESRDRFWNRFQLRDCLRVVRVTENGERGRLHAKTRSWERGWLRVRQARAVRSASFRVDADVPCPACSCAIIVEAHSLPFAWFSVVRWARPGTMVPTMAERRVVKIRPRDPRALEARMARMVQTIRMCRRAPAARRARAHRLVKQIRPPKTRARLEPVPRRHRPHPAMATRRRAPPARRGRTRRPPAAPAPTAAKNRRRARIRATPALGRPPESISCSVSPICGGHRRRSLRTWTRTLRSRF